MIQNLKLTEYLGITDLFTQGSLQQAAEELFKNLKWSIDEEILRK